MTAPDHTQRQARRADGCRSLRKRSWRNRDENKLSGEINWIGVEATTRIELVYTVLQTVA